MVFVDLNMNVHIENRQPSIIIADTAINISITTDSKIIFIL